MDNNVKFYVGIAIGVIVWSIFMILGSVFLTGEPINQWEYNLVETDQNNSITLNKFGFDGWELVSVIPIQKREGWTDFRFYFKRELQEATK